MWAPFTLRSMHADSRVRAFRGAIQIDQDEASQVESATVELVSAMLERNSLATEDLVSIIFTCTPDLHSAFPAAAARTLGLGQVPLICAQELEIQAALPRVIRVMMHAYSQAALGDIQHVYLRGATTLRQDLAQ